MWICSALSVRLWTPLIWLACHLEEPLETLTPAFKTVEWTPEGAIRILDQTRLPEDELYLVLDQVEDVVEAIKVLRVRGAPLIGVSAAMGLAAVSRAALARGEFSEAWLKDVAAQIAASRPTAVNLGWAIDRMLAKVQGLTDLAEIVESLTSEAQAIHEEDARMCRAIGEAGAELIDDGARVMTHCNAGALATGGIGTALAPVYAASDKVDRVFSCETRPLRQGARLTAWELNRSGVPVTTLADSAAGSLLATGGVDLIIVGADRIAANGDVANKIGTYQIAVLAARHGIPFFVAAPASTFDLSLASGDLIPIEQRGGDELDPAPGAAVFNPAFDVTPADLIAGLITDRGVLRPPYVESIKAAMHV